MDSNFNKTFNNKNVPTLSSENQFPVIALIASNKLSSNSWSLCMLSWPKAALKLYVGWHQVNPRHGRFQQCVSTYAIHNTLPSTPLPTYILKVCHLRSVQMMHYTITISITLLPWLQENLGKNPRIFRSTESNLNGLVPLLTAEQVGVALSVDYRRKLRVRRPLPD
jgi:hypothetical protein